jgi:transposase InsO family protein
VYSTQQQNPADKWEAKYPKLFSGIGKLKSRQVSLHIDDSVKPVAQSRRTPFHLREKVDKEIQSLLEQDIIEPVLGEPTPWVSPIVTPPKKDPEQIRLCVDMREANRAIERERHQVPTVDEIVSDLDGATVFSKLDLKAGYHQLELDPKSRSITTFSANGKLYRYKRLSFGVSSASEVFNEAIQSVIQDVPGTKNISDDIIVYGKGTEHHDQIMDQALSKISESGLTLNKSKCVFNQSSVDFFGVVVGPEGVSPDPKKVESIQKMEPPTNVAEARSFLGMINYSARFIPNYATISEPIRRLTRKDVSWEWGPDQDNAFHTLKQHLQSSKVISYFRPGQDIEVIVDASPYGLGAILSQNERVVAYASRSLTDTESRYSQIEREGLAVVWACEHFDMYLRGAKHFTVISDHKPLETLFSKRKLTLRLERWSLRLQPYKFTIKYRPGQDNAADYMSRHPDVAKQTSSREQTIAELYVNFITESSVPRAMSLDDIKTATAADHTLCLAMELVRTGRWFEVQYYRDDPEINYRDLCDLKLVRDDLTCHPDGILLMDTRIVVPASLREASVNIAHEGHQGMARTKALIRSKLYFPRMNEAVERAVRNCPACQLVTSSPPPMEPLNMSEFPSGPWEELSLDFCGPLPSGEYLMVLIDEYSRYPVIEILRSTSASTVIPILDKVLSTLGIPKVIKTDNGPPFTSYDFRQFATYMGFRHRRITPLWPRANAQAERFNRPLLKTVHAAKAEGKNWRQELHKFLRQYRGTPHPCTGFPPYSLMFNRDPRTRLPQVEDHMSGDMDKQARARDRVMKSKQKGYADTRNRAKPSDLAVGDHVLVREDGKKDKMSFPFRPKPYSVINRKGSMITAENDRHTVTRNASRFKRVPNDIQFHAEEQHEFEELPLPTTPAPTVLPATPQKTPSTPPAPIPDINVPSDIPETASGEPEVKSPEPAGRPQRARRAPRYLKDYVSK